jgi:hypothetical protein
MPCLFLLAMVACTPAEERGAPPRSAKSVATRLAHGAVEPPADATKLCGGHVSGAMRPDGKAGPHISWDAWCSRESRESLVKRYVKSLGSKVHARTGGCDNWRFPPDAPVKVLEICDFSEKGPWAECSSLPSEGRSIIMISSIAGR